MGKMLMPLRRYADFQGRSTRTEYWLWLLFVVLVQIGLIFLAAILAGGDVERALEGGAAMSLLGLFGLVTLIPSIAVAIRRAHDSDKSGWFVLIPIYGAILVWFIGGTPGPNRFGPDPRGAVTHPAYA